MHRVQSVPSRRSNIISKYVMPDSIQQSLKNNLQWIPFWHDCTDYSYLKIEFSYQSIFHQMQTPAIFVRFNFCVCFFFCTCFKLNTQFKRYKWFLECFARLLLSVPCTWRLAALHFQMPYFIDALLKISFITLFFCTSVKEFTVSTLVCYFKLLQHHLYLPT